jgi:hypothetical protein
MQDRDDAATTDDPCIDCSRAAISHAAPRQAAFGPPAIVLDPPSANCLTDRSQRPEDRLSSDPSCSPPDLENGSGHSRQARSRVASECRDTGGPPVRRMARSLHANTCRLLSSAQCRSETSLFGQRTQCSPRSAGAVATEAADTSASLLADPGRSSGRARPRHVLSHPIKPPSVRTGGLFAFLAQHEPRHRTRSWSRVSIGQLFGSN